MLVLINTVHFLRNRTKRNGTDGWKKNENGMICSYVLYSSVRNGTQSIFWRLPYVGTQSLTTTKVVIDGYTVNSTINSPATLPLGTTVILVCRLSGIPHGLQTNYHWICPNGLCQQTGYAGRKINNNIIAINITSPCDGGTYTCTVSAEGREASQQFQLKVTGQWS